MSNAADNVHPSRTRRTALTLVELLVVIRIIAVLVAQLMPAGGNGGTCGNGDVSDAYPF